MQQAMEYVSSQLLTGQCNKVHIITYHIDKGIYKKTKNKRSIFNQIRHIKETGNKMISLSIELPPVNKIGDIVKNPAPC